MPLAGTGFNPAQQQRARLLGQAFRWYSALRCSPVCCVAVPCGNCRLVQNHGLQLLMPTQPPGRQSVDIFRGQCQYLQQEHRAAPANMHRQRACRHQRSRAWTAVGGAATLEHAIAINGNSAHVITRPINKTPRSICGAPLVPPSPTCRLGVYVTVPIRSHASALAAHQARSIMPQRTHALTHHQHSAGS